MLKNSIHKSHFQIKKKGNVIAFGMTNTEKKNNTHKFDTQSTVQNLNDT